MDPWEVVAPLLRSVAESVVGRVAASGDTAGGRWLTFRGRGRRRELYRRLEMALVRARLRVEMLHTLNRQRQSLVNLELMVTGVRSALAAVEALRADVAALLDVVIELRDESPRSVSRRADELVIALTATMTCLDPGWWHPQLRGKRRVERSQAFEDYDVALHRFKLAAQADAAADRRARRSARALLKSSAA